MLFVTFGLLLGLGILIWCAALSVMQIIRRYRELGYPWDLAERHIERANNDTELTSQEQHAA
jgi:hypothetical protein